MRRTTKARRALAERGVHVLPGTVFDRPEHFRISLTATTAMVRQALPMLREVGAGARQEA